MEEIWKDIPEYGGLYQASNCGRIRSMHRSIIRSNGWRQTFKDRILKQGLNVKNGYLYVVLSNKEKQLKSHTVHSLVLNTFVKNTLYKKDINHKDSNKKNNKLGNLEYMTRSENMKHAYSSGGLISSNKGKLGRKSNLYKKVIQCDLLGNIIAEYFGTSEASRNTGVCQSCISLTCRGILKTSGGFIWKYI
jgi:hypothetical protein